jgi:hypothetical protein
MHAIDGALFVVAGRGCASTVFEIVVPTDGVVELFNILNVIGECKLYITGSGAELFSIKSTGLCLK